MNKQETAVNEFLKGFPEDFMQAVRKAALLEDELSRTTDPQRKAFLEQMLEVAEKELRVETKEAYRTKFSQELN